MQTYYVQYTTENTYPKRCIHSVHAVDKKNAQEKARKELEKVYKQSHVFIKEALTFAEFMAYQEKAVG